MHFFIFSLTTASAQDVCIPLKATAMCPAFASQSVSIAQLGVDRLKTGEQFDQLVEKLVGSAEEAQTRAEKLKCPELGTIQPFEFRYARTLLCDLIVSKSGRCNPQPLRLCKSSCTAITTKLRGLVDDHCEANAAIQQYFDSMDVACGERGSANCVNAEENEAKMCGFIRLESACSFCLTTKAECCANLLPKCDRNTQYMNFIIVGVSIAAVVGILFAILMIYRCCFVDEKDKKQEMDKSEKETIFESQSVEEPVIQTHARYDRGMMDRYMCELYMASASMSASDAGIELKEIVVVKSPYEREREDELELKVGDKVQVYQVCDDGWACGHNITTNMSGIFPMDCFD